MNYICQFFFYDFLCTQTFLWSGYAMSEGTQKNVEAGTDARVDFKKIIIGGILLAGLLAFVKFFL